MRALTRGDTAALLIGRDRSRSRRFLGAAVAVAVFFAVGPRLLARLSVGLSSTAYFLAIVAVTFVAAATNAYRNDGLLVSWALAAAGLLPLALTFALSPAPIGREPTLGNAAGELLRSAGLYGVVVGSVGFVVGVGVRWLVCRWGGVEGGSSTAGQR